MIGEFTLSLADPRATLDAVGGKGASLARLAAAGLPVPDGFHVTTAAYDHFVAENGLARDVEEALREVDAGDPASLEAAADRIHDLFMRGAIPSQVAGDVARAYGELPGNEPVVAVRSSATAEDLPDLSFAGQQETYLNIHGLREVLDAVKRCWASLWTARAIGYRERNGIDHRLVSLAVVVQILVPAEAAGILFTANPMNGRRDQAIINAAWGLGEAVVGGSVTPDSITVEKGSGRLLARETADKQVMTVRADGHTEERPVPEALRRAPVLDDLQAAELTRLAVQTEELYGMPMDIEWAWADGKFALLQARPITALPEPQVAPPQEWPVPNPRARYLRNNIVELMPDPLSPLFDSLGRRVINTTLGRVMATFFGRHGLAPDELIVSINGYAYYNGDLKPGQIGQILLRSVGIMRRMFRGMEGRWRAGRSAYLQTVGRWNERPPERLTAGEIVAGTEEVLDAAIGYYAAVVSGIIPAAWISEALFTGIYSRLIKRRSDPEASFYLLGFDSIPIRSEKVLYDLAIWAGSRDRLSDYLLRAPAEDLATQLTSDDVPPTVEERAWREWQTLFGQYLEEYGATIYDLDFAKPTPRDAPEALLEAFKLFLSGQGSDPHARQEAAAGRREAASQSVLGRLRWPRLSPFRRLLAMAQKYAPLREDSLADIGAGYPLMRRMLFELGDRLARVGAIDEAGDIFWLVEDEAQQMAAALDSGSPTTVLADAVRGRKAAWRAQRRVAPPVALPLRTKIMGITLDRSRAAEARRGGQDTLHGTPCSPGRATGITRVLRGPEDFAQMRPGDVLVAAITTPAWTPLFAMASAIVTDVGGPLSHGSIVAREYGIPAVLGTGNATKRIRSGQKVTVDGAAGTVIVSDGAAWRPTEANGDG